jgi:hypothetical protein
VGESLWDIAVRQRTAILGLIIWTIAVTYGSLQPRRPDIFRGGLAHSLTHIVCFGILSLLANVAFLRGRRLVGIAIAAWLFGFSLEVLQHFIYHRAFEWSDIRDDGVGIALGISALVFALGRSWPELAASKRLRD